MKQKTAVSILVMMAFLLVGCGPNGASSSLSSSEENTSIDLGENPLPEPSKLVSSLQDICDYVDYGIFHHFSHVDMTLDGYSISNLNHELAKIYWTAQLVDINPEIRGELHGDTLTVFFDYRDINGLISAAETPYYEHAYDVAYVVPTVTREPDFEAFPYTEITTIVDVETSDELWYVLDQGYQPLPKPESVAFGMLEKAKTILRGIINDSMSEIEKTRAIYDWMAINITYDYDVLPLGYDDAHAALYDAFYLEGALNNYRAVCDGMAKLFVMLARMEGLICHRVLGPTLEEYNNPIIGSTGHAWNIIQIGGVWYTIDPTGNNLMVDHNLPAIVYHRFFLTSKTMHDLNYAGGVATYCYQDIERVTNYDYYSNTFFTLGETNFDLVIESASELTSYIQFAKTVPYEHLSGEVILDFSYGGSIADELNQAFTEADWAMTEYIYLSENRLFFIFR